MKRVSSENNGYLFKPNKSTLRKSMNMSSVNQSRLKIDELRKKTMSMHKQYSFDQRSLKILKPKESKIYALQENAAIVAQKLQIQLQKEKYYEKEISELEEQIEERRNFGRQFNKDPKNLKKEIAIIKKKYSKNIQLMNETKAYNRQLRIKINNMRKERTIFDGIYTKLEKDILQKENKLLRLLEKQENMEKSLEKKRERNKQYLEHAQKEQFRFENNYSQIIMGINNERRESELDENVDIDQVMQNEMRELEDQIEENNEEGIAQENEKGLSKQNSAWLEEVEYKENQKRFQELEDLNSKFKKLSLLTQEEDFDYVTKMYLEGKQINDELYEEIKKVERELKLKNNQIEELDLAINKEKMGLDEEGEEIFKEMKKNEQLLADLQKKREQKEQQANQRAIQQENLKILMESLENILKIPEETEEEKQLNIGRSKNARLIKIEKRAAEAVFISDNYNEEDKGIVKEYKFQKSGAGKNDKDKMMDISEINDSIVEVNRDRENLIVETLPQIRNKLNQKVDKKLGSVRPPPSIRKTKLRHMTRRLTRLK